MTTRATIHFQRDSETQAIVYIHSDGYPEGLGQDLETFLTEVEVQVVDTRFSDPAYLAARFIVWQASRYVRAGRSPLDFTGVGVVLEDPTDIEYRYLVGCDGNDRPIVKTERM
jgi:hypothetical protein